MAKRKSKSDAAEEFKAAGEDLLKEESKAEDEAPIEEEAIPEPVKVEVSAAKAVAPPAQKAKVEVKNAVQRISFDRWFSTTGRPGHHKAGMRAYVKASGRKTKTAWDQLFAKY
jgi:hypothetical protein